MKEDSLILQTQGKRVELAYVQTGDSIFLASSGSNPKWPSSILRTGNATIEWETNREERSARLISNLGKKTEVLSMFREKYGAERTDRWYTQSSRIIELASHLKELETDNHYREWLEAEFDSIAEEYDRHIFGNIVNMLLRERSLALMKKVFRPGTSLLEVGCGTGTETIELLKADHDIVAVDISQKMLDSVMQKARSQGLESRLKTVKMNAENISKLIEVHGTKSFDGIYSTYGAINCVENLSDIPDAFHSLLKADGSLVMGIYNRLCASEFVGYALKLKLPSALARIKKYSKEGESRFCIDVYSYTLREISNIFEQYFSLVQVQGVPVLIPPSNFVNYVEKFQRKLDFIKKVDNWFGSRWPFYGLGDHFLTVMKPKHT